MIVASKTWLEMFGSTASITMIVDDWWIFQDSRLQLDNDEKYLDFLCEMIHPVVRSDQAEIKTVLDLFNRQLVHDGWQIIEKEKISGRPVFVAVSNDAEIQVQDVERIGSAYALSQLKKCDEKIAKGDYDGAISASRSLLEAVFADIYARTTGDEISKGGSLMEGYKLIRGVLNLSDDKYANDSIKNILRSIASIIDGLDNLSNDMGDRHLRRVLPLRHHAQLCINAAKTIVNFLYDTLEVRFRGKENIYGQLIVSLDSDARLLTRDEMLNDKGIRHVYARTDPNIRNVLKHQLIDEYEIHSFRESDIFFAALRILRDELRSGDLKRIYDAHKDNAQACGLKPFLTELKSYNAQLLTPEMLSYSVKT
jgi:AbiJ N-terminal domain 3/Abortive infection C-terminus